MEQLIPHRSSSLAGGVSADLVCQERGVIFLSYRWDPRWKILGLPADDRPQTKERKNRLWQSTCFEAFIQPEGESRYWEINLTPVRAWNAYLFESYRQPQPPREELGWTLIDLKTAAGELEATIRTNLRPTKKFRVGLSAIIETSAGEKVYWALQHGGDEPDFHDATGFLLQR